MDRSITTMIDPLLCKGCGRCVQVCPLKTLSIRGEKASVTGTESLNCGHCAAVCPHGAITVASLAPEMSRFRLFKTSEKPLPPGEFDIGKLVHLFQSIRSCRHFSKTPVNRACLEDLIKIGITAPSGGNSQQWVFTILSDGDAVAALTKRIFEFYKKINSMAKKSRLRSMLKLIGKAELEDYYYKHYMTVRNMLNNFGEDHDPLFHGATAAIIISMKEGTNFPAEDALFAASRIQTAAHCMGLGTFFNGIALKAMQHDPEINQFIQLLPSEKPYAVIGLGYPLVAYQTVVGRKQADIRYFSLPKD